VAWSCFFQSKVVNRQNKILEITAAATW